MADEKGIVREIMAAASGERWRQGANFKVEIDDSSEWWDGETWRPNVLAMCDESTLQRIFEGRMCMECFEPQQVPFPETCSLEVQTPQGVFRCGFPIATVQRRYIDEFFTGTAIHTGPTTTLEAELDRLDEVHERRMFAKHRDEVGSSGTAQSSILIPGKGERPVARPRRPEKLSERDAREKTPTPEPRPSETKYR